MSNILKKKKKFFTYIIEPTAITHSKTTPHISYLLEYTIDLARTSYVNFIIENGQPAVFCLFFVETLVFIL